ncbi:pyridoxal 5'-phosphate synthase [Bacillus sp. NEB1478]|uniref:pyridoxine/pyridoxamine 5'-phosphate oxidase n=1 Tax=Bacillus sp. NEB1478 TaxID=3073816 RepID=UPI002872FB8F|nr:pyridoxal 5'-phosphate synthase [Bacillus sp. NEB1478]WNB91126.1 pyridoxal 5'-phosphate synthase [Bacillus sp. NEB1478]
MNTREKIKASKTLTGPFPIFDIEKTSEYPHELFLEWFQSAVDQNVHEPHSMILSTTSLDGSPDARVLILKDVDEKGWYFASSSISNKGKQIDANPNVALTFYWSMIGRQVRIRGAAVPMGKEMSKKDFLKRGKTARAIALIERQSSILEEQFDFDQAIKIQLEKIQKNPEIISPNWTVYRVAAEEVEFWQGNEDRKHIRLRYKLIENKWIKNSLWA